MNNQLSILDLMTAPQYPEQPGFRGTDTSLAAAVAMKPNKARLQELVIDMLTKNGPSTSHELAYACGETYASIQPRTAELRAEQRIIDSGARRKTPSGKNSIVWGLV